MRFTVRRPASAEVSPCCHRPSGGDVASCVHVSIARPRGAGFAFENRLALAVSGSDVPARRASLRRVRGRDLLDRCSPDPEQTRARRALKPVRAFPTALPSPQLVITTESNMQVGRFELRRDVALSDRAMCRRHSDSFTHGWRFVVAQTEPHGWLCSEALSTRIVLSFSPGRNGPRARSAGVRRRRSGAPRPALHGGRGSMGSFRRRRTAAPGSRLRRKALRPGAARLQGRP